MAWCRHGPNNENNSIAIKKMRLAVFDLDHTLMPLDTGDMWVRWLVARSGTDPRPVASELERFAREYRAGVIDIDDFESFQMRFLSQFRRAFLNVELAAYVEAVVEPALPVASRRLVEHYTSMGDKTALCTATYDFVSKAVARVLGIDFTLAVKPEENDKGEFTGRLASAPSYSAGKVDYVRAVIKEAADSGEPFESVHFYSDSMADMPLFEFVESLGGTCFAVNPEKKLEALAAERDWEVLRTFDAQDLARWKKVAADLMEPRK